VALSQSTVLAQIRDLVATVTGMERVYGQAETDANRLPFGGLECPCALVMAGPTQSYILTQPHHRHTYHVRVLVLEDGGDYGDRVATMLPMVDRLIELFTSNVTLGGRANYGLFRSASGLVGIEWAGVDYTGYEVLLEISETATASAAGGS